MAREFQKIKMYMFHPHTKRLINQKGRPKIRPTPPRTNNETITYESATAAG